MTFPAAVGSALRQYATFTGRASRPEYWWFYLFTVVVSLATSLIDEAVHTDVIGLLASLALFLPSLAVTVRRLHDSNLCGWWMLLPVAPAVAGAMALVVAALAGFASAMGVADGDNDAVAGVAVLALIAALLLLVGSLVTGLVLMLRPSTPGPNRFGPDPRTPFGYGPGAGARAGGYPGYYGNFVGYGPDPGAPQSVDPTFGPR